MSEMSKLEELMGMIDSSPMPEEFDDDSSFDAGAYDDVGSNVLVESELQDDYSVKDADEGFDDDLDADSEPSADDLAKIEMNDPFEDE